MTSCSVCGHRNGSADVFCRSCGSVLGWDGQPAPAARRPVAAEVSAPSVRSLGSAQLPPGVGLPEQVLDPARRVEPSLPLAPGLFSVRVRQCEWDGPAPVRAGATLADATPVVRRPWWAPLVAGVRWAAGAATPGCRW